MQDSEAGEADTPKILIDKKEKLNIFPDKSEVIMEKPKNSYYIGRDGKEYKTAEDLKAANEAWDRRMNQTGASWIKKLNFWNKP